MSVVITNIGHDVDENGRATGFHRYEVKINNQPPVAMVVHRRSEGLAKLLLKSAVAVDSGPKRAVPLIDILEDETWSPV